MGALNTQDVARKAGISYRQLDYWLRNGVVEIKDPTPGNGVARTFTEDEVADIIALGRVIRDAHTAGLLLSRSAVGDVWDALAAGRTWKVTLAVNA